MWRFYFFLSLFCLFILLHFVFSCFKALPQYHVLLKAVTEYLIFRTVFEGSNYSFPFTEEWTRLGCC